MLECDSECVGKIGIIADNNANNDIGDLPGLYIVDIAVEDFLFGHYSTVCLAEDLIDYDVVENSSVYKIMEGFSASDTDER